MTDEELLQNVFDKYQADPLFAALRARGSNFVPGVGPLGSPVIFVGEAPGKNEDREGKPFIGQAGQLLNSMLRRIELDRERVYITNAVKYAPRDEVGGPIRTPIPEEIDAGRAYLCEELKIARGRWDKPKPIIVLLGRIALNVVLPGSLIGRVAGAGIRRVNGWSYFPMYHPAYILRQGKKGREVYREHFDRLGELLNGSTKELS